MTEPEPGCFFKAALFSLLLISYFFVFIYRQSPAVLFPIMLNEKVLTPGVLGNMSASFFYPYAFIQVLSGFISIRFGPIKTLVVFSSIMGLGTLLFSISGTSGGFTSSRIIQGIGAAVILVPILDIIERYFDVRHFHRLTCLIMAAGGLGSLAATEPLIYFSEKFGWRISVSVSGLLCIFISFILIYFYKKDKAKEIAHVDGQNIGVRKNLEIIFTNSNFWVATCWIFISCGLFISFGSLWGGIYLECILKESSEAAGEILGIMTVGLIIGSPLLSFIGDRLIKNFKVLIIMLTAIQLLLLIFLISPFAKQSLSVLNVWFFLFSVVTIAPAPLVLSIVKLTFEPHVSGIAAGLSNSAGLFAGGLLQSICGLTVGLNSTKTAFTNAEFNEIFVFFIVCSGIALISSFFIKDTIGNDLRRGR